LTTEQLVIGLRTLTAFRRWDTAEPWTHELAARPGSSNAVWKDFALAALGADNLELAQRSRDRCTSKDDQEELDLRLLIARDNVPVLSTLDEAVYGDLFLKRSSKTLAVAFSLLKRYPAFGIVFARGCLDAARHFDSEALLERIEDARDLLAVGSGDPSDALWHALIEAAELQQINEQTKEQATTINALRERLQSSSREVQALREQLPTIQGRLDEAKAALAASASVTPSNHDPTQLRRLRERVDELKALIREGSAERQSLRHELRAAHGATQTPAHADAAAPSLGEDAEQEHELELELDTTPLRRPMISAEQVRGLSELDGDLGKRALQRLGELASGSAAAWHQTKRLRAADGLLSSRIGIHHRLLFRESSSELEFVDLIPRRELDRYLG
jgi:regulator of replication initiation timing